MVSSMIMVNIERDILREKKFFSKLEAGPVPKEHLFGILATPTVETIVQISMNTTKFI